MTLTNKNEQPIDFIHTFVLTKKSKDEVCKECSIRLLLRDTNTIHGGGSNS